MKTAKTMLESAQEIICSLGLPQDQRNERTALCLLAMLNLKPESTWSVAENPLIGITPIMTWINENYLKKYAPNTRETFRRHSVHQFCDAGIALCNPDKPGRSINSPSTVYQISVDTLSLLRAFGTSKWRSRLKSYVTTRPSLIESYARARALYMISVVSNSKQRLNLSPGIHSELIKAIVEEFAPRFAPGSNLIYVGDTAKKWAYLDKELMDSLGVKIERHGKMPDVVLYFGAKNWLLLVESVTSHGPIDAKRNSELAKLFASSTAGLVYVSAFPNKKTMSRHLADIAWETEVWVAEAPSHLIHFNGERFLGPY